MGLNLVNFSSDADNIAKEYGRLKLPIRNSYQSQRRDCRPRTAQTRKNTQPQKPMCNRLTKGRRHATIFVERIMITCQQSKVSNIFGGDFTLITQPIVTDLQIFQKQSLDLRRFFGGDFQDLLDVEKGKRDIKSTRSRRDPAMLN